MARKMPEEFTEHVLYGNQCRRQVVRVNDQYNNSNSGLTLRRPVQRMESTSMKQQNICEESDSASYSRDAYGQQSYGTGAAAIAGLSTIPTLDDQGKPSVKSLFANQEMDRSIARSASHPNFGHSNTNYNQSSLYGETPDSLYGKSPVSPSQVVPGSLPPQPRLSSSLFFGDTLAAAPSTPGNLVTTPRAGSFPKQFQQVPHHVPNGLGKEAISKTLQLQEEKPPDIQVLKWTNNYLGSMSAELSEENILGSGGQGTVYKVEGKDDCASDREIVVKVLNEDCKILEQDKMKDLRHPFVMPVWDVCRKETESNQSSRDFIVYPLIKRGALFDHVVDSEDPLSYKERIRITSNSADGLAYLHEKGYVFRDVKSANILLDRLNNPRFGDYGLVKEVTECCWTGTRGRSITSTLSCFSSRQVGSYQHVTGTPGWVCPIYTATHKLDQRCDMWGFGMVMLQLLTGEPMFDVSRHEDTHFPLFVRLGIDECLEDEEKALEIMFSNKDTVKKIRQAGWPAIEDNVVSKEFAELALLCIRQSKLANRIPLDELRKKLQALMKKEGITSPYNIPDDKYCIYCLCCTRDKVLLTCGHQLACRNCLQKDDYLYCPFDGKQYSAIGHPGVFSLIIASKGEQLPSNEEDSDSDDNVFVMSGTEVAMAFRESLGLRNGNGISLCARTERKATRKEANSALDQFADKVKEVRKTHNNLPITLIVFLLGHFNEAGQFLLDDGQLSGCEILKKFKALSPENFLVFANGHGAESFLDEKFQTLCRNEEKVYLHSQTAQSNTARPQPDDAQANVALKRWKIFDMIGLVTKPLGWFRGTLTWITSWFGAAGTPQHQDNDVHEVHRFKNFVLLCSEAKETKTNASVHSFLTDVIVNALQGAKRCPVRVQNKEQGTCDVCSHYNTGVEEHGLITLGEFFDYVYEHPPLANQGAKWSGRKDCGEMAKLQLAYI